jgi:acyl dehydratase
MMSVRFTKPVYPNTNLSARLNIKASCITTFGNAIYIIVHVIGFETEKA